MLCEWVVLLIAAGPSSDVIIETTDGRMIEGAVEHEHLEVATEFGSARVRFDAIQSIEFGDIDVVLTIDQTRLRGEVSLPGLSVRVGGDELSLPLEAIKSIVAIRVAPLTPGSITDGIARNRVTYHLRAPDAYIDGESHPAIVILHGSNMNSRSYVETISGRWPDMAKRYILIGIDGEQRNAGSPPEAPTFNYTYVNYVGRSKYEGYPGTDRESPALVAELIGELKGRHRFSRIFVGGHSQGGFLTYSIMMNWPELIDGAFPMSGGLIVQCEPGAFDDAAVITAQKDVPLAIVHGTTDPVVDFSMSRHAYESFDDAGFQMIHLFGDESAGHRFAFLPLPEAIAWLEMMSADDAKTLLEGAARSIDKKRWRDALAILRRIDGTDADAAAAEQVAEWRDGIEAEAAERANGLRPRMAANEDHGWVDEFYAYREQFGTTRAAQPLIEIFLALRAEQQAAADELFSQSRADFQRGDQNAGYAKYRQIVSSLYASSWYRLCKRYLDQRGN